MKKKLQFISSTSASFKSTFESQLEAIPTSMEVNIKQRLVGLYHSRHTGWLRIP